LKADRACIRLHCNDIVPAHCRDMKSRIAAMAMHNIVEAEVSTGHVRAIF
jgi:hypothetical protein